MSDNVAHQTDTQLLLLFFISCSGEDGTVKLFLSREKFLADKILVNFVLPSVEDIARRPFNPTELVVQPGT